MALGLNPGGIGNEIADKLHEVLQAAPDLANSPGLAVAAAQQPNHTQAAQALSVAKRHYAIQQSVDELSTQLHIAPDEIHQAISDHLYGTTSGQPIHATLTAQITPNQGPPTQVAATQAARQQPNVVSGSYQTAQNQYDPFGIGHFVNRWINKPLSEVQHEYRYLHDVEATHGPGAAVLAGALMAIPGIAGAAVGRSPEVGILAAEATGELEDRLLYKDSWDRTNEQSVPVGTPGAVPSIGSPTGWVLPYRDPHTHALVSFGRDLASHSPIWKGVIAGVGDGLAATFLDPLAVAGSRVGAARDIHLVTPEDEIRLYESPISGARYRRGVDWMVGKSAGDIQHQWPWLAPIASKLANKSSTQEVRNVIQDAISVENLSQMRLGAKAPALSFTKKVTQNAYTSVKKWAASKATPEDPEGFVAAAEAQRTRFLARGVDVLSRSQTRIPQVLLDEDEKGLRFSGHQVDPFDPQTGEAIYLQARYGLDEIAARGLQNNFLGFLDVGDDTAALNVLKNTVYHSILGRAARLAAGDDKMTGVLLSPDFKRNLMQVIDEMGAAADMGGTGGVYGATRAATKTPPVVSPAGDIDAGLLDAHTGLFSLPDLAQTKRIAQALVGAHSRLGFLDDATYRTIIQGFWKPMALLNVGSAERIATSEILNNWFRLHGVNLIKGFLVARAAKAGTKLAEEESGRLAKGYSVMVWNLLGRPMGKVAPEDLRLAMSVIEHAGEGRTVPEAVGAHANYTQEFDVSTTQGTKQVLQNIISRSPKMRSTNRFGLFGVGDQHSFQRWSDWLNAISRDEPSRIAAQRILEDLKAGVPQEEAEKDGIKALWDVLETRDPELNRKLLRSRERTAWGISQNMTPLQNLAYDRVQNLMAAVSGKAVEGNPAEVNMDLLEKVADPEARVNSHDLERNYDFADAPEAIPGRQFTPVTDGWWHKIISKGFNVAFSPIINTLAREPIYFASVQKMAKALRPAVEAGLEQDAADSLAMSWASMDMIRHVHNLGERTQFSELVRSVSPFFFAQQQALKRVWRLFAADPGAARRYMLAIQGVHNIASQHTDEFGNGTIALPGVGNLTQHGLDLLSHAGFTVNAPLGTQWNGSAFSTNVIMPMSEGVEGFRPSLGPAIEIPVSLLKIWFPELAHFGVSQESIDQGQQVINDILGPQAAPEATSGKLWQMIFPSPIAQRMFQGLTPSELNTYYASGLYQAIQILDVKYQEDVDNWYKGGQKGPAPTYLPQVYNPNGTVTKAASDLLLQLQNTARVWAGFKLLIGTLSPLSPSLALKTIPWKKDVQTYINKYGVAQGLTRYTLDHPDMTAMTVFSTDTARGGAAIPETQEFWKWYNSSKELATNPQTANGWMFFAPPADSQGAFSLQVYNDELAQGLKKKDAPDQFLAKVEQNDGAHIYYDILVPQYTKAYNAAGSSAAKKAATEAFHQQVEALDRFNPTWAASSVGKTVDKTSGKISSNTGAQVQAQQDLLSIRRILADPKAPKTPMTDKIKNLVDVYDQISSQLPGGNSQTANQYIMQDIQNRWYNYLQTQKTQDPTLGNVINTVFFQLSGAISG